MKIQPLNFPAENRDQGHRDTMLGNGTGKAANGSMLWPGYMVPHLIFPFNFSLLHIF